MILAIIVLLIGAGGMLLYFLPGKGSVGFVTAMGLALVLFGLEPQAEVQDVGFNLQIVILFIVLTAMAFFFFTEKLPVDLTAFAGLVILILGNFLEPSEAFTGFASPAVITMLSIFFVSGALLHTGLADMVGARIHKMIGSKEIPLIITLMVVAGVLSAFMNNIAATAVLLPAVASVAKKAGVPPSRLFMPLSFGAILGGTTTLVGTPPNILANDMLQKRGAEGFSLFDFTPLGLTLLGMGVIYMITIGRKLLPKKQISSGVSDQGNLDNLYKLRDKLSSIRIPPQSKLDGMTLRDAQLGAALGVQVLGIVRDGRKKLAPTADTVLRGEDVLIVKGQYSDLEDILRLQGVQVGRFKSEHIAQVVRQIKVLKATVVSGSPLIGDTLHKCGFRFKYHCFCVGIRRDGQLLGGDIARLAIREGDQLLVACETDVPLDKISAPDHYSLSEARAEVHRDLRKKIFVLTIPDGSHLIGETVGEVRIDRLMGLSIIGLSRGDHIFIEYSPDQKIRAGDSLLVTGDRERVRSLVSIGGFELEKSVDEDALRSEDVGVIEATVSPRSGAAGQTLAKLNFRDRYGLQVLAIWRGGKAMHTNIGNVPLQFGDALLLQGSWKKLNLFGSERDFVALVHSIQEPKRTEKAPHALGALALMVALVASGWQPIHVAAFVAATAVVLSGTITMEEAYRSVEWRAIFLVAAVLPVGIAMERTGAAALISQTVTDVAGPMGPYAILGGLCLLASFLSQCLDGAPAVVLLTPVAMQTAEQLGVSTRPIMMGISLSASAAFMTPFSHKANLLVMGAGGYKVSDYLKVGTPLTIVILAVLVVLVPIFFPF